LRQGTCPNKLDSLSDHWIAADQPWTILQALNTGKGPFQNWQEHVADPWNVNGFNYATKFFGATIGN
jgi:hypothetical protein